ncbi:MAG: hypothetical protein JSS76_18345 [Bacteroidetes bacterium]|nr:hypothetical protein [Bacteroidota bacterium]
MKHKITLLTFSAFVAVLLCSYRPGPAHDAGANCTGSDGGTTACGGAGCHTSSLSSSLGTTLEFDSAGTPVTSYVPGGSYTVKITATNATGSTLPKFGFQLVSITAVVPEAIIMSRQAHGAPACQAVCAIRPPHNPGSLYL